LGSSERHGKGTAAASPQRDSAAGGLAVSWRAAVEATVSGLGYELVDVERAPRGLLRVFIDRVPGHVYPTGAGEFITVDDCEAVTRQLQYALEVDGVDYARLEVSSPGLDRPLKTPADYERFEGQAVSLVLKLPFQGRKSWQGVLTRAPAPAEGWQLVMRQGAQEQALGFAIDEVREARLVPVVDFKGRKAAGASPAAAGTGTGAETGESALQAHPADDERLEDR
jgi:ribosome maturation factor RimP